MKNGFVYPVGSTEAIRFAAGFLPLPMIDHPAPEVGYLLLDVPSFRGDGQLRGGGAVENILERLPETITVIGGNLEHPALERYETMDLLQDAVYLAQNAGITAQCAVKLALPYLGITLLHCPVLVIGWGRIGKCLGKLLQSLGADVTISARKEADRAMIRALGYEAADTGDLDGILPKFRLIYNTVPYPVLAARAPFGKGCVKIELASKPGIEGGDVIDGRGLPGKLAPESSGRLIAETIMRRL